MPSSRAPRTQCPLPTKTPSTPQKGGGMMTSLAWPWRSDGKPSLSAPPTTHTLYNTSPDPRPPSKPESTRKRKGGPQTDSKVPMRKTSGISFPGTVQANRNARSTHLQQVSTASDDEYARTFISQFFPPPPPIAPLSTNHHTRDWAPLTREEVSKALKSCKDNLALGPSQVTYKAVKWAWEAHPLTLWYLYSHCFNLGHYPAPFKTSITTVVNKPNHTDPSSFRPIQLMECSSKVLEKISTKQIQFKVTNHDIIPGTQFSGHSHSSTLDAGLSLSQDIHNAWGRGLKSTALIFDISGFFNFTNHNILTACWLCLQHQNHQPHQGFPDWPSRPNILR